MSKESFNPVKEEQDGVKAHRVVWSTKTLEAALKGLDEGRRLVANPFYDNNPKILKGNLVFKHTAEEREEWKKCANDIHYFADTYCKLMTPEGVKNVTMRDYQNRYLDHLLKHRLSVYLAARQCGKCVKINELVTIKKNGVETKIPLFELYNECDKRILWKLKYLFYKFNFKHKFKIIDRLISFLDLFERDDEKLIKSFDLHNIQVLTDTGFKQVSQIHLTRRFQIYRIELDNGYSLECADTHIVFDENMREIFIKDLKPGDLIQTDNGLSKVKKLEKVNLKTCMCDMTVNDSNHRYYTSGILSHNTTTSAIFLLWYIVFNIDKNALVVADVFSHAKDIMEKTKSIFMELPFFLRPGVFKWTESQIVLDNGCKLIAQTTTPTSGVGYTLHCVLWDEVAATKPSIKDKFFNYILPTVQAGHARLMLSSTQGGFDLFYRVYTAAAQGLSEFGAFKTDWDEIPEWNPEKKCWEKRDEAWHQQQVANYGSEEAFNSQFGTSFDINANTLINVKYLRNKQHDTIEFINKDLYGVSNSQYFFWKPDYEPMEDLRKDFITVTIDIAEGIGGDYTIFNFNRMTEKGDEVIGFFRANTVSLDNAVLTLMEVDKYMHPLHHCISLEYNTYGELFISKMREQRDKYPHVSNFDESNFVKYYNESMSSYRIGIKLTSNSKPIGCKLFKEQYEKGIIENISTVFLAEMENFSDSSGNGVYKASFGHDDEVMATIQLVYAKQSNAYKYLRSEFDSLLGLGITTTENIQTLQPRVQHEQVSVNRDGYFDPTKVFNNMNDIYASMASNQQDFYMSRLR